MHPIRIVPLYVPPAPMQLTPMRDAAVEVAPPAAHLTYRGGPLLTSVSVVTVYWGPAWAEAPLADTAVRLDAFFDAILTSDVIDRLAEYTVPGSEIGPGRRIARAVITDPAPGTAVTDAAIRRLLTRELAATPSRLPPADPNTLYFVYTPPGTAISQGGARSCQEFCGYHDHIDGTVFYAAMPYPGCSGCTGDLPPFDALTSTSSHELCEAITDPVPGTGWYDDQFGEIGDICAWKTRQVAGYTVQLEWSNAASGCI